MAEFKFLNSIARSLGLHDFYQVGLWNYCEGYNDTYAYSFPFSTLSTFRVASPTSSTAPIVLLTIKKGRHILLVPQVPLLLQPRLHPPLPALRRRHHHPPRRHPLDPRPDKARLLNHVLLFPDRLLPLDPLPPSAPPLPPLLAPPLAQEPQSLDRLWNRARGILGGAVHDGGHGDRDGDVQHHA